MPSLLRLSLLTVVVMVLVCPGLSASSASLRAEMAKKKKKVKGELEPTFDEVAVQLPEALWIDGKRPESYTEYARKIKDGGAKFFGVPIRKGVHPAFAARLEAAEALVRAEYTKAGKAAPANPGIRGIGGMRPGAGGAEASFGAHKWGYAIDIDVPWNPYIVHLKPCGDHCLKLEAAWERIAALMVGVPVPNGDQSVIPRQMCELFSNKNPLYRDRKPDAGDSVRAQRLKEYYDRLHLENEGVKRYFALMRSATPVADINAFLKKEWAFKHPPKSAAEGMTYKLPDAVEVLKQMWIDYRLMKGKVPPAPLPDLPADWQPPAYKSFGPFVDRPPEEGFMSLSRELVVGLGQGVSRWGAIDFDGASGDIQHFDDNPRFKGYVEEAYEKAKALKNAKPAAAPANGALAPA